jgi:hypothetical protein
MFIEQNKEQIANLERQKIAIKEEMEWSNNPVKVRDLEDQLYDIEDTLKKLTQGTRIV